MKAVWKYEITKSGEFSLSIPTGAQFLSIKTQFNKPVMYFLVDPDNLPEDRKFFIAGTGHKVIPDSGYAYLDTFSVGDGIFMWHIFACF